MYRVVFQKPSLWKRFGGLISFDPTLLVAGFVGILMGLAFFGGNWMQVLVVSLVPFILYAVVKNTMAMFLVWIGTSPILTNFVRIDMGAGIPDITVDRVASLLLLMALVFQVALKMRTLRRMAPVEWVMLAIFLVLLPGVARAREPVAAGQLIYDQILTPFIAFFLAKNLLTSEREIRALVLTLGIVTLYCAVLGFQEHFTEYSFFTDNNKLTWQQEGMADRIQGPFNSPQVLGTVMVGGIVFFFYLMVNARSLSRRLLSLGILVIYSVAIYWTYRRSVWMGYGATLIFLSVLDRRFRKPVMIAMLLGTTVFLLNLKTIEESQVFQERMANSRTVNDRYIVWLTSYEIARRFPVFGTGFGWFSFYYDKYFTFYGNTVSTPYAHGITSPHNSYIRLWVEGGVVLVVPYLLMLVFMVRRMLQLLSGRLVHPTTGTMEVMVLMGMAITQYVQALTTDMLFHAEYPTIMMFMIAGVLFQDCTRVPKRGHAPALGRGLQTP
ncbi:MAG: O-antigen ligase family protein [Candidatus Latescibacteria bacterium]|nr:O-antigen ligase family protein [Candidatus Latescibacterota bacterium]